MKRPIWLISMDSDQFAAAPMTTGGLKAYYQRYGRSSHNTDIEIVHFLSGDEIANWLDRWHKSLLLTAKNALQLGIQPIVGLSFYTWNTAEFLELIQNLKASCPELLIVAGGPHVQQAEDYLFEDPIDIIILGEGEETFCELLDCDDLSNKHPINGLAYLHEGKLQKTPPRERIKDLDSLPSALDIIPLTDSAGSPLYDSISYETSRGCPYRCAFCEWGTGAIGGKMYQVSLPRIRRDWEHIIASGIKNIWLADSNFGALKEDLAKAELICELKDKTGLPSTFATSWSKKHSTQVQQIALLLNRHDLLPHYQLALQTLTPLALELSNRKNMSANKYEPIARQMAEAGVPIAAELIWGLPGDNLASFEQGLDRLLATFPNINIFGYTLLPGTEFYRKRQEYKIQTLPVAGYGKAKGEYVIGCHTFSRDEGIEGYFLISAHIILIHGHVIPLTTRYLALSEGSPTSPLLRAILRDLIQCFKDELQQIDFSSRMDIYENRDLLYVAIMQQQSRTYRTIKQTLETWFKQHNTHKDIVRSALEALSLDQALSPRVGNKSTTNFSFMFHASRVLQQLQMMQEPKITDFKPQGEVLTITHPGGVGDVLRDPDGGSWMKGEIDASQLCSSEHSLTEPQTWVPASATA